MGGLDFLQQGNWETALHHKNESSRCAKLNIDQTHNTGETGDKIAQIMDVP